MSQAAHTPDPSLFWEAVNGFQRSATIRAAVELDVFTAIASGSATPPAMAVTLSASERGLRILCDALTVWGFLTKSGGAYALTPDSALFLDRRSPAYLGGMIGFLQHPFQQRHFDDLAETIRRGSQPDVEDLLTIENEIWVEFARSMVAMMAPMSEFLGGIAARDAGDALEVLDIAAGHGMFGIGVAKAHRGARITAVDWPKVLEVARSNAEKAGVADRYETRPGSAFDVDLGSGYDVVLVTNFYHHFDKETCLKLAKRFHSALRPGGRMLTLEFIPDPGRISPPQAAVFPLVMLANTPAGDAYTFEELDGMFREAGFQPGRLIQPPFGPQRIVESQC